MIFSFGLARFLESHTATSVYRTIASMEAHPDDVTRGAGAVAGVDRVVVGSASMSMGKNHNSFHKGEEVNEEEDRCSYPPPTSAALRQEGASTPASPELIEIISKAVSIADQVCTVAGVVISTIYVSRFIGC